MRDAFISSLFELAKNNKDIIFISDEFGAPALDRFREELPGNFINGGISEQNIISVAAGLSLAGRRVYVYGISVFVTLRCLEQIKIDLCAMKLPVTIVGVGTCYSYSADGPTHHATEDISVMRSLAGMSVYSPSSSHMAGLLAGESLRFGTSAYIRLDRESCDKPFGEIDISKGFSAGGEGDIALIATGNMVRVAVSAALILKKTGISVKIIDLFRIKPLNADGLYEEIREVKGVVTLEEHTLSGGLGGLIAEFLFDTGLLKPLKRIGISDELLYSYGKREELHRERGLDPDSVAFAVRTFSEDIEK